MIFVGIDVGKNGGIVAIDIDGAIQGKWPIPNVKGTTDTDLEKLTSIFHQLRPISGFGKVRLCIEDVHSIFGSSAKSNFNFGRIRGVKEGIAIALGYKYDIVKPQIWQRGVWEQEDVVIGENGRRDPKLTSLNAAQRLWPNEDFKKSSRSKVPHDGLVDAALIAEYCRRIKSTN